jgi:hypothetical protein
MMVLQLMKRVILVLQPQPRQANFGGEFLDLWNFKTVM